MASVESTIVGTAMPTIVADLGGLKFFAWVFGIYFLGQAITIPIYGRLSDVYGRKRMLFIAIAVFLAGSIACGLAPTMTLLVIFRAIQGLGAGGVQPVATTVVGDIYTAAERAKYQGYLSSTWGVSAVIGPLLGAFLLRFTWSAIFWVNIPIGILCIIAFWAYREPIHSRPSRIDLGSLLSTIVPLRLLRHRVIAVANAGCFLIGAAVMGVSAFLPTYVQAAMGKTALVAGIVLGTQSIFWTFGSIIAGRVLLRTSYRVSAAVGGIVLLIGALLLIAMDPSRGPWWAGAGAAAMGLGFGMSNLNFLISTQASVGREERGSATASILLMRNLGQTVGTAILGAVFNFGLLALPNAREALAQLIDMRADTEGERAQLAHYAVAIAGALHNVYLITGFFALGVLGLTLLIPKGLRPR